MRKKSGPMHKNPEPTEHMKRRTALQIIQQNRGLQNFYLNAVLALTRKGHRNEPLILKAIEETKRFANREGIPWKL